MMLKSKLLGSAIVAVSFSIGSAAVAQTAPALTSVQIRQVFSTQNGTETISPSQTTTALDHGGTQVRITVREIGYAQTTRTVTLNGSIVSNTANPIVNLCGSTSAPTTCSAGQTVIGFDRTYQIDGSTGGTYAVTARNSRSPFNAITDTLIIQ